MSDGQIQKFLGVKELKIKMSSVLDVSNGDSKSEEFSISDIEVVGAKLVYKCSRRNIFRPQAY